MSASTSSALTGELSFATVQSLLERGAATVDLSGVTRADSAGLALLLEWTRAAQIASAGDNKSFSTTPAAAQTRGGLSFENTPPQLRKLAEFFGLSDLLALN